MNTQDPYEVRHAGARARLLASAGPAGAARLEAVRLCARVAARRRRSRPGSFRRAAYDDQLDRALETLRRAVALEEGASAPAAAVVVDDLEVGDDAGEAIDQDPELGEH